jgi:hypothetical protein
MQKKIAQDLCNRLQNLLLETEDFKEVMKIMNIMIISLIK